jgi:hypothetical protein
MDIKCPLITQNGEWRYQIGDSYLPLKDILSQFPNYSEPSMIQSAVDAIKNTSFTGELTDDERRVYGNKTREQLLVSNCKIVYQKMYDYVESMIPSDFASLPHNQKYSLIYQSINNLYDDVFGHYTPEMGLHSIAANGVIESEGKLYTLYSSISFEHPKADLIRMAEDLTMGFYKTRGGTEYKKTPDFIEHLKEIPSVDLSNEEGTSLYESPEDPSRKYVVTLSNELDTKYCDILGGIVATFLSYVEHVKDGFSINPDRISSDSDYYSSVFASTDLEMLGAISADMKDYSMLDHKRISTAAKEIYPVVDNVKGYLFKTVDKNRLCDDISRLNDLVKQGKIHIEPVKSAERE